VTGVLVFPFCFLQSSLVVPNVFLTGLCCRCLLLPVPRLPPPLACLWSPLGCPEAVTSLGSAPRLTCKYWQVGK